MKKYLSTFIAVLFMFLFIGIAQAGEKTLAFTWEQVISTDFAGWHLYQSEISGDYGKTYALDIPYEGDGNGTFTTTEPITSPDGEEHTYYFVLTAYDEAGNESEYSNEVNAVIDFEASGEPFNLTISVMAQ